MKLGVSKVIMLIATFSLLGIVSYLFILNVFVIPSKVLVPVGNVPWCHSRVIDNGLLIISGNISLDHAFLCYEFQIQKMWSSIPATVMIARFAITNYSAPWHIRGYSIEVSSLRVVHGLEIEVPTRVELVGGRTDSGRGLFYSVLALMDIDVSRYYNTSLHILMRIRATQWSLLGPIKTMEIEILNKTIPLSIKVKYVEATPLNIDRRS